MTDIEYIKFLKSNINFDIDLMKTEECKNYSKSIIEHIDRFLTLRNEYIDKELNSNDKDTE